jgi:putative ABC transport system permease protein
MADLCFAFRQLVKNAGFSSVAIVALALGIGASTAMFAVVYAFLLRPLPYANPEQLVMLHSRSNVSGGDVGVNYLDFVDWKAQSRSFSDLAFFNLRWNGNLELADGTTETLKTTFTTWNVFGLLGVEPVIGRNFMATDDAPDAPKVVMISERLWQRAYGGDRNIVGRDLRLDGAVKTIVGVMPKAFRFPSQTDLWVPMGATFAKSKDRRWRADQAIARLKPGVPIQQARAEMNVIADRTAREHPDTNKDIGAAVVPLREQWVGSVQSSLVLLLVACCGVLFIACANVSQLLLMRATSRRRELALRAALGASRTRIARQLLTESALLAFVGCALGIVFAVWIVDALAAAIPIELPSWIQIKVDPAVLFFTTAIAALTAIIAGSLPAWHGTRVAVAHALKQGGHVGATATGGRTREFLSAMQIAASVILLIGAGLVMRSMTKLSAVDPGFDPRGVLMFEVNPTYTSSETTEAKVNRFERLLQRIRELPQVEFAAANNSPPFVAQRPWNRAEFVAEGQSTDQQRNPLANFQTVSRDYFSAVAIPLRSGRTFDEHDNLTSPRVCIVSDSLANRLWPGQDAIGKRLKLGAAVDAADEPWLNVIGVAADVHHQALDQQGGPELYDCSTQVAWKQMHFVVRVRGTKPDALANTVRREVAAVAPDVGLFNFVSLEKEVADSLWQPRLRTWLFGFFSVVALVLCAAGLYGSVGYGVAQRTREIGIRMALGATRAAVLRLILGSGTRSVALGLAAGLIIATTLSRALKTWLFGISNLDAFTYVAACVALAATALVACWLPAQRASGVDPIEALRAE